jgi:hypothetical protein
VNKVGALSLGVAREIKARSCFLSWREFYKHMIFLKRKHLLGIVHPCSPSNSEDRGRKITRQRQENHELEAAQAKLARPFLKIKRVQVVEHLPNKVSPWIQSSVLGGKRGTVNLILADQANEYYLELDQETRTFVSYFGCS